MSYPISNASLVHSIRMQVREHHYIPFMQYHAQQGQSWNMMRVAMWEAYENCLVMKHMDMHRVGNSEGI